MCFDQELLKPFNQCAYTNLEKLNNPLFCSGSLVVRMFTDLEGRQRILLYSDSKAISGLLLEKVGQHKSYIIKGVYTASEERRKGYAKQLLALARFKLGKVRHSSDLTKEGELWMKAVEKVQ